MGEKLGRLVVSLEANIAEFNRNMNEAAQRTEQTSQVIMTSLKVVAGAIVALGAVEFAGGLIVQANDVISALADLDDMSQKTGSSVEMLSRLGKVATMTGADMGGVDAALVKLSKNLASADEEGNKTAKALAAIGISTADIKSKDPSQLFVEIANKLQGYEDGAAKVALVTDLMGKSAADLLPYMNDVSENIEKFTGNSTAAAGQATRLQDGLGELRVKYDELKTGIVVGALPAANAFIGALQDTMRESDKLANHSNLTTWADHAGLVLARMADGGVLVGRTLKAIGAEMVATSANFELMSAVMANSNPVGAAKVLAAGGSPTENIKAALAKRNDIIAQANVMVTSLWTQPLDAMEQAFVKRLADGKNEAGLKALGNAMGLGDISTGKKIDYKGGESKVTKTAKGAKAAPEIVDPIPAIARMRESAPDQKMADRLVQGALNETLAIQGTVDATMELMQADQKRADAHMRAMDKNAASVERIRQDLMTDVEHEQLVYESKIEQLRIFGESRLGSEMAANAMIEQETARHMQAKLDMQTAMAMQMVAISGGAADQLYDVMKKAGMEQTALAKAVFLVSKALAVAEIIMNTNVAASKAEAQFGAWGVPIAMAIRVAGYASAGMTAGLAIAEVSAEGGYDIPAGTNPMAQLHEKEMVLPKAQADVIRNLARNGTGAGGGGGGINQTITINIDGTTDMEKNRKMVAEAVARGNADLVDRLQRSGRI